MVMPRLLTLDSDGFLRQNPVRTFESQRGEEITAKAAALGETPLSLGPDIGGGCLELEAQFTSSGASSVGIRVRCDASGAGTEVSFNPKDGVLTCGKVKKLLGISQPLRLRIFLDKRAMEIYANEGAAAIFTTVDAAPNDTGIQVFAKGGAARLESLKAWPLKPAKFSAEHFQA